jgi:hypothetical protein
MQNLVDTNTIWIFSDEIARAKELIEVDLDSNLVRWIEEVDQSPASTMELMRHGVGYVIANSTFSWWAAYLSYNTGSPVIAPDPWFKEIEEPAGLIPPSWNRLNAF